MNRRYHPAFETDLVSAALYYEKQRRGLGGEFIEAAEAAVEIIMAAPPAGPSGMVAFVVFSSNASRT